jgi:hypothetical protein
VEGNETCLVGNGFGRLLSLRGRHTHFHVPKPLHGWREFIGEVGIIVIGC